MTTVNTAISIQRSLLENVDALALELGISRSRLFALAVENFIQRHQARQLLETIDDVYGGLPDSEEEALHRRMRHQHRQMVDGRW